MVRRMSFTVAAVVALAAGNSSVLVAQAKTATFLNYQTTVPDGWASRTPSSSMRLAEYTTGSAAEVVVYFFGPGQGGGIDANLERWKSQFSNPTGGAVYEKVTRETSGAFPITVAEYRGTYARGVGAGSDADAARPDHVLIAAVAESPRGTLFFQMFGPTAAVTAQRDAYLRFVRALK